MVDDCGRDVTGLWRARETVDGQWSYYRPITIVITCKREERIERAK